MHPEGHIGQYREERTNHGPDEGRRSDDDPDRARSRSPRLRGTGWVDVRGMSTSVDGPRRPWSSLLYRHPRRRVVPRLHLPLTGTAAVPREAVSLAATSSRGSGSGPTELLSPGAGPSKLRPMVELGKRLCGVEVGIDPASRWVRPSCTQRVRTAESGNRDVRVVVADSDRAGSPCKDVP